MAVYPAAYKTWVDKTAGQDILHTHVNDLQYEVDAIAKTLGLNPQNEGASVYSTVSARITDKAALAHTHSGRGTDTSSLLNSPHVLVTGISNQNITTNTDTFVSWDTDVLDVWGFHDPATNTSRLTVPTGLGGLYLAFLQVAYSADPNGRRGVQIRKNDTSTDASGGAQIASTNQVFSQNFVVKMQAFALASLSDGDQIRAAGFQSSGSTLTMNKDSTLANSWFGMVRVA